MMDPIKLLNEATIRVSEGYLLHDENLIVGGLAHKIIFNAQQYLEGHERYKNPDEAWGRVPLVVYQ
jgi:hypothetical protein